LHPHHKERSSTAHPQISSELIQILKKWLALPTLIKTDSLIPKY
jgi:hypothetical protein